MSPLRAAVSIVLGILLLGIFGPTPTTLGQDRHAMRASAPAAGPLDLAWSTLLGGARGEDAAALAVDGRGAVLIGGETSSADLATAGVLGPRLAGLQDAFVARLGPGGGPLDFFTYLGGSGRDTVIDLVVDRDGSILVAGYTDSNDLPVTASAYDTSYNGANDAFVARLDASGTRVLAASYLGGRANDYAESVRLDAAGNVYVAGETWSADMPTTAGAFAARHAGGSDMFLVRLDAGLEAAGYATFLGGAGDDCADCTMDASGDGRATVVLKTNSSDLPTTAGAFDTSPNGGYDAFVARLSTDGRSLELGTYLGGRGTECEEGCYVSVAADGTTWVAGNTSSSDFPVTQGAQDPIGGGRDAFLARLSADGSRLALGRRYGGSGADVPRDILPTAAGDVLLVARTDSVDFPVTADGFDPTYNAGGDVGLLRLDGATGDVTYGTYLGGDGQDGGWRPRVRAWEPGGIVVVGSTASANYPTTPGSHQPRLAGGRDAFALLLVPGGAPTASATPSPSGTPSPTATAAPSATATPTETTVAIHRAFLPLLLSEACPPKDRFVDVALVVDASTSMRQPAEGGGTKLDAAIGAVQVFLAGLRLAPGQDRVALVAFNDQAHALVPLGHDANSLTAALGAVTIREQSRIDLGILRAAELLAAPRPDGERVIVLLSDGLANPVSGGAVLAAADTARAAGILQFAVGFGKVIDEALLRGIVGEPERYAAASSAGDLTRAFRRLTVAVPCPSAAYWPVRRW